MHRKPEERKERMLMLQKQRRRLVCFALLATVLVGGNGASAAAIGQDAENPISVQSINVFYSDIQLNISGTGTANISAGVSGKAGVSKIQMTIKLQKYNSSSKSWTKVKSWDRTVNSANATFNTSYKLGSKGTYRCKMVASVWKNGKEEKISLTSSQKSY